MWIPPIGLLLRYLSDADFDSPVGGAARQLLESQFGFWTDTVPSDFKLRLVLNLALFLSAIVVGFWAIVLGGNRMALVVVAAAQSVVALVGVVFDFAGGRGDIPDVIAHTIPAPGGRYTSFVFLALAVVALGLSLSAPDGGGRAPAPMQTF